MWCTGQHADLESQIHGFKPHRRLNISNFAMSGSNITKSIHVGNTQTRLLFGFEIFRNFVKTSLSLFFTMERNRNVFCIVTFLSNFQDTHEN